MSASILSYITHYDNKIAKFSQGAVVIGIKGGVEGRVGHVVRFHLNSTKEVIVQVAFADDEKANPLLHPSNIELLSTYLEE